MRKLWLEFILIPVMISIACTVFAEERRMTAYEYCQEKGLRIPHIVQEGLDSVSDLTPLENELVPIIAREYSNKEIAEVEYVNRAMYDKMLNGEFIENYHTVGFAIFCLGKHHHSNRLIAFFMWQDDIWVKVYNQKRKPKGTPA